MESRWGAKRKEREEEQGTAQRTGTGAPAGSQAKSRRTAASPEAAPAFRVFSASPSREGRATLVVLARVLWAHRAAASLLQHENVSYEDGDRGHIQRMLRCCAALCRITVPAVSGNARTHGNGFLAAVEYQGIHISKFHIIYLFTCSLYTTIRIYLCQLSQARCGTGCSYLCVVTSNDLISSVAEAERAYAEFSNSADCSDDVAKIFLRPAAIFKTVTISSPPLSLLFTTVSHN